MTSNERRSRPARELSSEAEAEAVWAALMEAAKASLATLPPAQRAAQVKALRAVVAMMLSPQFLALKAREAEALRREGLM